MKIPAIVPSALCVTAGILLAGREFFLYFQNGTIPEMMPVAIGLYFIGKGLFIHSILTMLCEIRQTR